MFTHRLVAISETAYSKAMGYDNVGISGKARLYVWKKYLNSFNSYSFNQIELASFIN